MEGLAFLRVDQKNSIPDSKTDGCADAPDVPGGRLGLPVAVPGSLEWPSVAEGRGEGDCVNPILPQSFMGVLFGL